MKDELGGKIMIEFVELRPNTYSSLMDDAKCLRKQILLQNNKIILKSQQRFKSKAHNVFTEDYIKQ